MIHFSTLPSGLFPAEEMEYPLSETLTNEDERFFNSLKARLNESMKEPRPETIERIMDYSSRFTMKE